MDSANDVREFSKEIFLEKKKKKDTCSSTCFCSHKCCFPHLICNKYTTKLNKISYSAVEVKHYCHHNGRQVHQILIHIQSISLQKQFRNINTDSETSKRNQAGKNVKNCYKWASVLVQVFIKSYIIFISSHLKLILYKIYKIEIVSSSVVLNKHWKLTYIQRIWEVPYQNIYIISAIRCPLCIYLLDAHD